MLQYGISTCKGAFLCPILSHTIPTRVIATVCASAFKRRAAIIFSRTSCWKCTCFRYCRVADPSALVEVEGISEKTATAIKVTAAVFRRMAQESYQAPKRYEHFEDIARYLQTLYAGITVERVHLLLFDNGMKLLDCVVLDEGTVNQANITPRKIVEQAIKKDASAVLLAHNHPKGVAIPSSEDIATTNFLQSSLRNMGITLIDHVIVGRETIMPILNHQMGNLRPSPLSGEVDEKFYKSFYGRFDARGQE